MRADEELFPDGASAAAVLAVAEGLRRRDPQLAAALAEHAARMSGDAHDRGEAALSAVLARRELDRPDEVVARGVPALRDAQDEGRDADVAVLRAVLADAALSWADTVVATAVLAPLGPVAVLPDRARPAVALARADLAAAAGRVEAVDELASELASLSTSREDRLLVDTDLTRARARARRVSGDLAGARALLDEAAADPVPDAVDGGRRRLLVVAELVEVLVDLAEPSQARSAAAPVLAVTGDVVTALPSARLRCALASGVHLPEGALDEAELLARAVQGELAGRGHARVLAAAEEILATVAERRGDLSAALVAQRRAHDLDRRALLAEAAARVELAVAVPASTSTGAPGGQAALDTQAATEGGAPTPRASRRRRSSPGAGTLAGTAAPASPAAPASTNGTGRRRARDDGHEAVPQSVASASTPAHVTATTDAEEREAGPVPHGLSRVLDEITADARSSPADLDAALGAAGAPDARKAVRDPQAVPDAGAVPDPPSDPTPTRTGASVTDEYADELRLTLVDLLAEYGDALDGPETAPPAPSGSDTARRAAAPTAWSFHDDGPPTAAVPVQSVAGAGPALDHGGARNGAANGVDHGARNGARNGANGGDADSGARLADLLAEAMDAFRRTAPGTGTIGPVPPDHHAPRRGARR